MPLKPAILQMVGGKSQRQRIWEALRAKSNIGDGLFTIDAISRATGLELCPIQEYLLGLSRGGYIRCTNPDEKRVGGKMPRRIYELARDNGVEAPRVRPDGSPVVQGRGTEAMWAAMTALDTFNHHLLADIANVRTLTASRYCQMLGKAGFLEVVIAGKGTGKGGIATTYRVALAHRQKVRAPMITRLKTIYDPNTHEIVWAEGADEAADNVEVGEVVA